MAKLIGAASYNDGDIKRYTGLEHVRNKSSMYVKSNDTIESQVQIFKEVIDNSVDESIDPNRLYVIKIVFFHNRNRTKYQVMISDSGRGVPINRMGDVFTELFSSGKYNEGSAYSDSAGTFGVGIKTTVGLSNKFVAISKRLDGIARIEINKGVTKRVDVEKAIDRDPSTVGTLVFYEPDDSILSVTADFMDKGGITQTIQLLEWISVYSANTTFEVYTESKLMPDNFFTQPIKDVWSFFKFMQPETAIYISDKTITPFDYICKKFNLNQASVTWQLPLLHKLVNSEGETDRIGYDIEVFLMKDVKQYSGGISAAVNKTSITDPESYHIVGLHQVLKTFISPLILDEQLKEYFVDSYKLPLYGSIMTRFSKYTPVGQTKDSFKDSKFLQNYLRLLTAQLKPLSELTWETFFDVIKDDLVEKFNKQANKDLQLGQGLKNLTFRLNFPGSLINCTSTDNSITEIFITEGDSAGKHAKNARNTNTQAIFIAKGKPINAFRVDKNTLYSNKVIQDLIRVLNVSPNDKDLSRMNFHSIGLLADADSHGYHIVALFIGILYKINPLIISEGRVFIVNPPLYLMKHRTAACYLRDYSALMDTKIATVYSQTIKIEAKHLNTNKWVEITGEAFRHLCYGIDHIGKVITAVANTLSLDPMHLEQWAHCVDYLNPGNVDTDKIAEMLGMDKVIYNAENNVLTLIAAGQELNVPLIQMVNEIKAFIIPELKLFKWPEIELRVTGLLTNKYYNKTVQSFMQLYRLFRDQLDKDFPVDRMKGLGSMPIEALADTCLNPLTRSITRITSVGDLDKIEVWLGVSTTERKKLVEKDLAEIDFEND